MKLSLPRPVHRLLSATLALAMLSSNLVALVPRAYAADAPPASASGAPPGVSASSSPSVVSEIEASRTADSSTYALSDGSRRTDIYTEPVHFQEKSGQWADIDPTLVPTGEFGRTQTRATEFTQTFGSDDSTAAPVTVSNGRWSLGMELLGAEQSAPFTLGDQAIYPLAQTATQLDYESRRNGVKDTLVLSSPAAPDTFTFFLKLSGLEVFAEPGTGAFALYDAVQKTQVGRMEPLSVRDSAAEAVTCTDASLSVTPVAGGAYVTYRIPRSWLTDPARVFPVLVDPTVTFQGTADTRNDTYIAKGDSAYHYADNHLDTSQFATGDLRRALVNFMLNSVTHGSIVNSAVLQMYAWQNSATGDTVTNCQPLLGSWGYNATWANTFGNGSVSIGTGGSAATVAGGPNHYAYWDVTNVVQRWLTGELPNNGFVVFANNETGVAQRSFWSSEYSTYTSRQPHLVIDYTPPSISADPLPANVHAGDEVTIATHVTSSVVTNAQAKLDGRLPSGAATTTAQFAFTTQAPGTGWVSVPVGGGYLSYAKTAAVTSTTPAIVPDLSASTAQKRSDGYDIDFAYRVGPGAGAIQSNRLSVIDVDWSTTWQDTGSSYQAITRPVTSASVDATASDGWFDERAANSAGALQGRGSVALTWAGDPLATGYGVYLFDGNAWQRVATTTVPAWTTAGARVYPADAAISALASGFAGNPFAGGTLDLRDDPRALYAKTPGAVWDDVPAYGFKIAPFDSAGAAPLSECATIAVSLAGRTLHLADAPRHAEVAVGPLGGDDARVRCDRGEFTLSASDVAIPGPGPDVAVGRVYRSSVTTSSLLAPGWRFSFERSMRSSATTATYTDENGDEFAFRKVGDSWTAPHGDTDRLSGDASSGFTLHHKDRSTTTFDSAGKLASESDAFGNTVRYEWATDGSRLVIRAPQDLPVLHERRIVVDFAGGRVAKVTAHAGSDAADRIVTYTSSGSALTVTALPGTDSERTAVYGYDARGRIVGVSVPGFQPSANGRAAWSIDYDANGTSVSVANETGAGTPRAPKTVSWNAGAGSATIVSATGTSAIAFDPLGEQVSSTEENTSTATRTGYDVEGHAIESRSPSGRLTRAVCDGRGNEFATTDELGGRTTRHFTDDLCAEETDPRGAVTRRSYDSATGALLAEDRSLNDEGDVAHVDYAYNGDGTLARERKSVTATLTAETDYADYAECGRPQTTSWPSVEVAPGSFRILVAHASYDGWGDEVTRQDALGVTVASNRYDAAGRILDATDASGTVSHTRYGVLGDETKRWRSHPATTAVADCWETASNALGSAMTEVQRGSDGATVSAVVHTYDEAGREVASDDSAVPGTAVTRYDEQGNVNQAWDEGANTSLGAASYRSVLTPDGEEARETAPGATTASTVTSYTADGQIASYAPPTGSAVSYAYDGAGDVTTETLQTDAGPASTAFDADLDGRVVGVTDPDGTTETASYNLQGEPVLEDAGGSLASSTRYNALGWPIEQTDSDGVVTRDSYDADGRVLEERVGTATTRNEYDACGRITRTTAPDGSVSQRCHDCFGDEIASVDTSGGAVLRSRTTSYDDARRVSRESLATMGGQPVTRTHAYASDGTDRITETRRGGAANETTIVDGAHQVHSIAAAFEGKPVQLSVAATDAAGRVTSLDATGLAGGFRRAWSQSGQLLSSAVASSAIDFGYSTVSGRLVHQSSRFSLGGRTETADYSYDLEGRLATATVDGATASYRYDPATGALASRAIGSAVTRFSYETSGTGRLIAAGPKVYAYDSDGHRTAEGSAAQPALTTYGWSGDRLTSVAGAGFSASYVYDGSGQRLRSSVTSGGVTTTTLYESDGVRLNGLSAARSDGASWTVDYLYDGSGNLCGGAYQQDATTTLFATSVSARGDVRELLDTSGRAFALYTYDPYGLPLATVTTATPSVSATLAAQIAARQPLRYAGYVYDAETGLSYCSARYYDPSVASFLSKDPQSADGEESAYQYCSGDPIDKSDPNGTDVWSPKDTGSKFYQHLSKGEYILVMWCLWKVGQPYVFGAKVKPGQEWKRGPVDCSGLTAAAYRLAHKQEPRVFPQLPDGSANQHDATRSLGFGLAAAKLRISDLGFLHYGNGDDGTVHHVGIYIGRGQVVEARGKKWGVVKTTVTAFNRRGADWHRGRKK